MVQSAPVIATLLKENPKPIFLLGAGASVTSGIPLAGETVSKIAKWAYARQNGKNPDDPRITRSDWYPWLAESQTSWFKENVQLANLFPDAVENLLLPKKVRKEFWVKILSPDVPTSIGYLRLAELMHFGRISTVLTANFDDCIAKARNEINRPHHIDFVKTPSEYIKISGTPNFPMAIYLHGDVNNYSDKNVTEEVSKMDSKLVQKLVPILRDHPLVVVGYRGYEQSIMEHLLINSAKKAEYYKNGIYWCIRKGEDITEATDYVKTLSKLIGPNFTFVEIESFDHLFDKVIWSHLEEQKLKFDFDRSTPFANQPEPDIKNFDLKSAKEFEEGDFDEVPLRIRIEKYCNRLKIYTPEKIDKNWLNNQLIYLNLTRKDSSGKLLTTNAGLLLFSKLPQQYIPSAKITIRFIGPQHWLIKTLGDSTITNDTVEWSIEGNLWNQLETINDTLATVNRPFLLKGEESKDVLPYDAIALKEVIVNSLIHRDYESDLPNILEVTPDTIKITNPGGVITEVMSSVEDEQIYDVIKKGKKGLKGYRNPVLADLFYGAGAMDKRGSGLADVITRVENNAGYVEFNPNLKNTEFSVKLQCRPEAVDEITRTATPLQVITTKFSTNIIPLKRIPEYVSFAESSFSTYAEVFKSFQGVSFPPFEFFEKQLFTLTDLNSRINTLRNVINTKTIDSLAMDEFLAGPEGEKRFIKLLNKSVENHLWKLGLIVDKEKKRAYFPRTLEGDRIISYQARIKKAKRTVVKARLSANKEKVRYWEHKAFYYGIKKMGEEWGLIIEPSYVFTLDGTKTPLASKRVGALATKKASRDYNLNVLNDLVFWMWNLAKGDREFFILDTSASEKLGDNITLMTDYVSGSLNLVEYIDQDAIDELDEEVEDDELENEIALLADMQRLGKLEEEEEWQSDTDTLNDSDDN